MDDLIFKNIPTEGFDTESRFTERVSNPTPSRKNSTISSADTSFSVSEQYCSNYSTENPSAQPQDFSQDSRLSNPTPTRRRRISNETMSAPVISGVSADDYNSRLSSATPTRRCRQEENTNNSSFGVISGVESSRNSNPTPRRRGNSFVSEILPPPKTEQRQSDSYQTRLEVSEPSESTYNIPPINSVSDQAEDDEESLSFASVDNPYGVEENNIRISVPPIVRKPFESETISDSNNADNNRLSNYTPTHRK